MRLMGHMLSFTDADGSVSIAQYDADGMPLDDGGALGGGDFVDQQLPGPSGGGGAFGEPDPNRQSVSPSDI